MTCTRAHRRPAWLRRAHTALAFALSLGLGTSTAAAAVSSSSRFSISIDEVGLGGDGPVGSTRASISDHSVVTLLPGNGRTASHALHWDGLVSVPPITNQAPSLADAAANTLIGNGVTIALSASDTESDPLVYTLGSSSNASSGTATIDAVTGAFSFTPSPGFAGNVAIPVRVGDGWQRTTATVTISVVEPSISVTPTGPIMINEAGGTAAVTIALIAQPTGPVTVAVASTDTGEFTPSAGSVTFTPGDWSARSLQVSAIDDGIPDGDQAVALSVLPASGGGYAGVDADDVSIIVADAMSNARPWIYSQPPMVVQAGLTEAFPVLVDTSDLSAPTLSFSLSGAPAGTSLTVNADARSATTTWPVDPDASEPITFSIIVHDTTSGTMAVQTITAVVDSIPSAAQ